MEIDLDHLVELVWRARQPYKEGEVCTYHPKGWRWGGYCPDCSLELEAYVGFKKK